MCILWLAFKHTVLQPYCTHTHTHTHTHPFHNFVEVSSAQLMPPVRQYSGFHVCSPSRGTMLTGRIPVRWGGAGAAWTGGVFTNSAVGGLPANETTMPELLKGAGYATAATGCVTGSTVLPPVHG